MEFEIVYHFPEEDEDCDGEYYHVTVHLDDKELVRYGDHYHEKGGDRAEAFIHGYLAALGKKRKEADISTRAINDAPNY